VKAVNGPSLGMGATPGIMPSPAGAETCLKPALVTKDEHGCIFRCEDDTRATALTVARHETVGSAFRRKKE
jgi:hypothetical protein